MVSNAKRMRYVSENYFSGSDSEDSDDMEYTNNNQKQTPSKQGSKKQTKWLSKNAIMARENRRKKKMYVSNLEHENSKLKSENRKSSQILNNQTNLISQLQKEIKYLKSVIANSSDIGKLLKNIHNSSGMSVTTSLDQTLSLNNDCISKQKQPIARKTAHPWEETHNYPSFPTPESFTSPHSDDGLDTKDLIFNDIELPPPLLDIPDDFLDMHEFTREFKDESPVSQDDLFEEHNYTSSSTQVKDEAEDVGVCLHVSKHRVSLEFCSTCCENATKAWDN